MDNKDMDAVLDAVKELTKIIGELKKEFEELKRENIRWFKAGRH